jgi:colanic acid/amylovoran biosynthesis glycosyltransferase
MRCKLKKIGYLVPEFPGQTHNFFWREIGALKELGVDVQLYSTRRPPLGLQSTTWGRQASSETIYLHPLSPLEMLRILWIVASSPSRIISAFSAWRDSSSKLLDGESKARLFALMILGLWLGHQIKKNGMKHLHVHSCADAANIALFAQRTFGVNYSMTLHNPISIWGGNQENKWKHALFGIIITDWIRKDLDLKLGPFLPKALYLAPMGVDVAKFQRSSAYIPRGDEDLRVFSCARLNPAKGFSVLLNSIAEVNRSGLKTTLTIAGEDDEGGTGYRKEIEQLIVALEIKDCVHLLGSVSEERVKQELELAHVFVLASLEEPLGVAIMEAMSMEVPVISTNAGGVPALLANDHGIMVPPGNVSALAEAISSIGLDQEKATALSKKGRALIAEKYHHQLSAKIISNQSA